MTRAQKHVVWIMWCCLWAAGWTAVAAAAWPRRVCGLSLLVDMRCMVWQTSGSLIWAIVFAGFAVFSLAAVASPLLSGTKDRHSGAQVFGRDELENLWVGKGGNPDRARLAAAVALAESGGDSGAVCEWDGRIGLWQVPGWVLAGLHPHANAVAAIELSRNGEDWSQFPGYTGGAYRQFMGGERP